MSPKAVLFAAALATPLAAKAGTLTCKSARAGLELTVPLSNASLVGNVRVMKAQRLALEVPPDRIRDLEVTGDSVMFTAVDASGGDTILKLSVSKNEYDRYVGYMLFTNMQYGLVCTEQ